MVNNVTTRSRLYDLFNELGLRSTDDYEFQKARKTVADPMVKEFRLSKDLIIHPVDKGSVYYSSPHFELGFDVDTTGLEFWLGDEYINYSSIEWIEGTYCLYGLLPHDTDAEYISCIVNGSAFKRYSNIKEGGGTHTEKINLSDAPMTLVDDPTKCCFAIVDGEYVVPDATYNPLEPEVVTYTCSYQNSIDMFWCSTLLSVMRVEKNVGVPIHNPYGRKLYYRIIVDHDPGYPIDSRFYPYLKFDKNCVIRVYTDQAREIPHPEISRLLNYPEFIGVGDPYNTDNEYLNNLEACDVEITDADSDEEIMEKFKKIVPWCYHIWRHFPRFDDEQSDFLIRDNTEFGDPIFSVGTVRRLDGTDESYIVSEVPFEDNRDVLFYNNIMFHDYQVGTVKKIGNIWKENDASPLHYLIRDTSLDPDRFTVLKFNAAEDTVFVNIGDYFDENNVVELHHKLNRFCRNLLVLRGKVLDSIPGENDAVRISTVEPETKDEHMWFELLVNVNPDMFAVNPIGEIAVWNLDPNNIPDSIRVGAYALDMDPLDGPTAYTKLLLTYFGLEDVDKQALVLQGINNADTVEARYDSISTSGTLPENPEINDIVLLDLDNPDTEYKKTDSFYAGTGEPEGTNFEKGDIYLDDGTLATEHLDNNRGIIPESIDIRELGFTNTVTREDVSGLTIASMDTQEKINLIESYITQGTDEEKASVKLLWDSYLVSMDEDELNLAVYKVLMTDYLYQYYQGTGSGSDLLEETRRVYYLNENEPSDAKTGDFWLNVAANPDDYAPMLYTVKKINIDLIVTKNDPEDIKVGTYWIDCQAIPLQDFIWEYLCRKVMESGSELPEGEFTQIDEKHQEGTIVFDYGAHGMAEGEIELFRPVVDNELHPIHYGTEPPEDTKAVWYEFLGEINGRVCYADLDCMVLRIDERLLMVEFVDDHVTAFVFDDIFMNFRGTNGIRYLGVLADLINSGEIKLEHVNMFYGRLLTARDSFDPMLKRLYTGRSHVLVSASLEDEDFAIAYSTNVERFHVDYESDVVNQEERTYAWKQVIDLRRVELSYLPDRMLLFVNGKFIPQMDYEEMGPNMLHLLRFDEVIVCVDIVYSKKDLMYSTIKKLAQQYWKYKDTSSMIQHPERDYKTMETIDPMGHTKKGYYDVLLSEYIFNNRLVHTVRYLKDKPNEWAAWKLDFLRKFHAVSDVGLTGVEYTDDADATVVIPCLNDGSAAYTIK